MRAQCKIREFEMAQLTRLMQLMSLVRTAQRSPSKLLQLLPKHDYGDDGWT